MNSKGEEIDMKNRNKRNVKDIILRTLAGALAVVSVAIGVVGWNGISCDDPYLNAYFAKHPENSRSVTNEDLIPYVNFAIQDSTQFAQSIGSTNFVAPTQDELVIQARTRTIQAYQKNINALQLQYQNAIATGNIAYAQQCVNLVNVWNAKIAEEMNYLNAYKAARGIK